jgi:hypothetical protein
MSTMSVVYFWLRENQTPYYVGYGSQQNAGKGWYHGK